LNYFIKSIINQLFDLVKQNVSKDLVFFEIYKCFLKKGANYLNHESLEFLKCAWNVSKSYIWVDGFYFILVLIVFSLTLAFYW
jgi:hypothetical protein